MPRTLFDQTVVTRHGPKRSKWTIAGSVLAHAALVAILLVVPVLSALDDYVLLADNLTFVEVPAAIPAMPVAPPASAPDATVAPDVNPDAAPREEPSQLVLGDPPPVTPVRGRPDFNLIGPVGDGPFVPGAVGKGGNNSAPYVPPPPPAKVPIRPGGDVKIPSRTYYVEPVYPSIARAAGLEALVILEATIDESGIVRNVKVLRSHAMFDQAAVEAVSKWKYTPTLLNGTPVPVVLTVTVNFSLR